jgi:hypothetical protein
MPLLIKLDNKRLFDKPTWLPPGEVPAEALQGFRLDENNELSVWFVESDRSNLDRILTALAANRDFATQIDYAIFDETVLSRSGITPRKTPGRTPDPDASAKWHWDLIKLSGRRLLNLAEAIGSGSPQRKSVGSVKELLNKAAREGRLQKELMREGLASKLEWPNLGDGC